MTEKPFRPATSAESRSLLNKADIVCLRGRYDAQQKVMDIFIKQTVKKINCIVHELSCERLTRRENWERTIAELSAIDRKIGDDYDEHGGK